MDDDVAAVGVVGVVVGYQMSRSENNEGSIRVGRAPIRVRNFLALRREEESGIGKLSELQKIALERST